MPKHPNQPCYELADILGPASTEQEVLSTIYNDKELYELYTGFTEEIQKDLLDFFTGKCGPKITYDTFFKMVFDPYDNPERLEEFLAEILGQPVKIKEVLQCDSQKIHAGSSIVIMDIVLSLSDGSVMDVEIQKVGYAFPGERSCCYAADLILRQYNRAKKQAKKRKQRFSFRSLKPVYVIILMEESPIPFKSVAPHYIHRKVTTYDSNAKVAELSNIVYISLDTFRNVVQNIDTPLHAWLTFLSAHEPKDILRLVNSHPEFLELYQEIAEFRTRMEDIMGFFSDALIQMDLATEEYMWEEMKKEKAKLASEVEHLTSEVDQLAFEKDQLASEKDQLSLKNERLNSENENLKAELASLRKLLSENL